MFFDRELASISGSNYGIHCSSHWRTASVRHHFFELVVADKQPIRVAGEFLEIPHLIERFRGIVKAVEDDRHEGKRVTGFVAVPASLGKQKSADPLSLLIAADAKPANTRVGIAGEAAW
jgi:hypothetical protein